MGCASTPLEKQVIVNTVEIEKTPLNIPSLAPPNLEHVKLRVIEYEGKWYIAYVLDDYVTVSDNMEKLQQYILNQNLIINQYKNYYEPPK